ncbi:hypothetical protein [Pseudorhodoferax sp.]|uniref:hypothetical protein n=1 Tax=Pseudorhodoferax sp. TaxID=1993553 RepID=UPI0039E482F0
MFKRRHWLAAAAAAGTLLAVQPAALAHAQAPAATAAADAGPTVHLLLQYESHSIGQDGVQRDSRHTDRMVRDGDRVWIERVLPQVLRDEAAHGHKPTPGPHAGHAHDEAQNAPLLLQRQADGQTLVQIVLREQRRVIEVEKGHHGNVGYGGSWAAAYWLIDPQALQRMEKLGPPRNGVQRYRLQQGERRTEVDWDLAGRYVRTLVQQDMHGLSSQRLTVKAQPLPARMPWDELQGYARGDYSDLLD